MNPRRVVFVAVLALILGGGGVLYKSPISFAAGNTAPAYGETHSNFFYTQAASVYTAVQDFWNGIFGTPAPQVVEPAITPASQTTEQPPLLPLKGIPVPVEAPRPPSVGTTTIVTRIVERIPVQSSTRVLSGITTTDLESQIAALRSELLNEIAKGKTQAQQDNNSLYLAMAPMNRINNLSSVTISNPTITGATVSAGSLSGTFSGSVSGTSGSFTTLGVGTSTPSDTFAVNGVTYLADVTAPSVTTNRLYSTSGNLYWAGSIIGGSVGSWTLSGSDVYRTSGNVGIGTTSPFTTLSVTGNGYLSGALNVGATSTTRVNLGLDYATSIDVLSRTNIAAWGDSLTYNPTGYPEQLGVLTGIHVYNGGISSETSTQIKTRMLAATDKYGYETIIWAGRNNYNDPTTVKADIAAMVAALTTDRYIILGIVNGDTATEYQGGAGYTTITTLNNDLAAIYGSHYIDIRAYLIANGLTDAGITPTAQDLIDIGHDVPPASLRTDSLHYTTAGYASIAKRINQSISLLTRNQATVLTPESSLAINNVGVFQKGARVLFASTTDYSTLTGVRTGSYLNGIGLYNTANGYHSLYSATSSSYNTSFGANSLYLDSSGLGNNAFGYQSLYNNTIGNYNNAFGYQALVNNTEGGYNNAFGYQALQGNTTGHDNTGIGFASLYSNLAGNFTTGIGYHAFFYNTNASNSTGVGTNVANGVGSYSNTGGTYMGYNSAYSLTTGSDYNTTIGYQSGYGITSGARNIIIGPSTLGGTASQVTTGSKNIAIGNDIQIASSTASNQLNIGNLIYGTGLSGTGTTLSPGNIGIGTTTPYAKLSIHANNGETNTTLFAIASSTASATTSLFTVLNTGNVGIGTAAPAKSLQVVGDIRVGTSGTNGCVENFAGTALTGVCSSDISLKTNIQPIGSVLADLTQLTPSTFYWNDIAGNELHNSTTTQNYGLIAQDVARVLPSMVATTSSGYLGVNYSMLPILTLQGLKDLDLKVEDLASTTAVTAGTTGEKTFVGRFFDRITGWLADAANGLTTVFANVFNAKEKICVDGECLTKSDIKALLDIAHGSNQSASVSTTMTSTTASSTPITISINGNNPAIINVGETYGDLGAFVTSPESAKNFGIKASLDGGPTLDISQISLDTSAAGSHTIVYSVVDQKNATTTAERIVNVVAPASPAVTPSDTATTTSTQ